MPRTCISPFFNWGRNGAGGKASLSIPTGYSAVPPENSIAYPAPTYFLPYEQQDLHLTTCGSLRYPPATQRLRAGIFSLA